MSSIEELITDAMKDPSLASSINIDKLLEINREHCFEGKTVESIMKEIITILETQIIDVNKISEMGKKLMGYQYIDQICDIRLGKFVRWVNRKKPTLHRGGIVTSIQIEDSGIKLLCQNVKMGFSRLKWEDCIIFQQLSLEEQMILQINEKCSL